MSRVGGMVTPETVAGHVTLIVYRALPWLDLQDGPAPDYLDDIYQWFVRFSKNIFLEANKQQAQSS